MFLFSFFLLVITRYFLSSIRMLLLRFLFLLLILLLTLLPLSFSSRLFCFRRLLLRCVVMMNSRLIFFFILAGTEYRSSTSSPGQVQLTSMAIDESSSDLCLSFPPNESYFITFVQFNISSMQDQDMITIYNINDTISQSCVLVVIASLSSSTLYSIYATAVNDAGSGVVSAQLDVLTSDSSIGALAPPVIRLLSQYRLSRLSWSDGFVVSWTLPPHLDVADFIRFELFDSGVRNATITDGTNSALIYNGTRTFVNLRSLQGSLFVRVITKANGGLSITSPGARYASIPVYLRI
jgi:hypothetical protein